MTVRPHQRLRRSSTAGTSRRHERGEGLRDPPPSGVPPRRGPGALRASLLARRQRAGGRGEPRSAWLLDGVRVLADSPPGRTRTARRRGQRRLRATTWRTTRRQSPPSPKSWCNGSGRRGSSSERPSGRRPAPTGRRRWSSPTRPQAGRAIRAGGDLGSAPALLGPRFVVCRAEVAERQVAERVYRQVFTTNE